MILYLQQRKNKEQAKHFYCNNEAQRQIYNLEYWALSGHKYTKQRSKDSIYKSNQPIYLRAGGTRFPVKSNS
jgi:hypothetical protein